MLQSEPLFTTDDHAVELCDSLPSRRHSTLLEHPRHEENLLRLENSERGLDYSSSKDFFALGATLVWRWSIAVLRFIIPSFLRKSTHETSPSQLKRNDSHAAIDGLRGLACLIVAFYHYFGFTYESINHGYVWDPEQPNGGPLATRWNLPIIKIVLSGPPMVSVFFVISGYVLSYRFLTLVHQGRIESAVMSMTSAVFRRFIRLFMPLFLVTLILQGWLQLGVFEHGRTRDDGRAYPPRGDGIVDQLWYFWVWWREAVNPFTWDRHYPDQFDGNMWTIPIEYRCSMVLFLVEIGLARVRLKLRVFLVIVLIGWALNGNAWEVVLFLLGMLVAQADVYLDANENDVSLEKEGTFAKWKLRWIWYPIMFAAIYLCSMPWFYDGAWGFQTLVSFDPFENSSVFSTWQTVGATLMVICALHFGPYRAFLNSAPIQYLGHVSYSLYLCHGPLVKLAVYSFKWDTFDFFKARYQPENEDGIIMISVWVAFIFYLIPMLFLLSDIFMRAIDQPVVVWSRKAWEYCTK